MGLGGQCSWDQLSLGDSKALFILLASTPLSVQVTVQKGFFFPLIDHLTCLVANEGNYFSVLVPGSEKMNRHLPFPAVFPNL